ncbi:hypothetical protein DY000_02002438 [Brassica cretica]|uniref:Neprosin PEP catalytic domain-containing protein n=1 Tax=Brassica cretica TaxID=69181 RepID=A0ABQ7CIF4_BRACR|nr:hypothetical protein DY000_02002438 [Brassica cretica]
MALHLLLVLSSYMFLTQVVEGNLDDFDCVDIYKQPAFQHPLLKHHKIQFATIETVLDGSIYRGAQANISLHSLNLQENQYSKSQIWLENGPRNELNSIQVGWAVHPRLYGDTRTRFTMYWTLKPSLAISLSPSIVSCLLILFSICQADGYKNSGCYNIQCPGFVIVTQIPWIGKAFSRTSIYGSNESVSFTPQVFQVNFYTIKRLYNI